MKKLKILAIALCAAFFAIFSGGQADIEVRPLEVSSKPIHAPIKIVTTLEVHKAIVEDLIGSDAEVEALIPTGLDPCKFSPVPSDRQKLDASDLWIGSKQFFESKVAEALPKGRFVCVHEKSPHELMSPEHLKKSTCQIAKALKALLPSKSASIDRNLDLYINKIDLTSARVKEILSQSSSPKLLALHPTYAYFCEAFGVEHIALENCHGGVCLKTIEKAQAKLQACKSVSSERPQLLVEPSVDPVKAKRVAETLGSDVRVLDSYAPDVLCTYLKLAEAAAK